MEDGNPTDRLLFDRNKNNFFIFSFCKRVHKWTDRQTDRQTRRGSRRPQSFRSGGSVVSCAPAVFFAAPVASAGRVDAAVVAVLSVAAEEGVGRVQLVSGTPAKKVQELFELLVPAELLPSLRLRPLLFRLLPLSLLLLQQLLLLLFRLLLLKQKKKVIFVKIAGERKREEGREGGRKEIAEKLKKYRRKQKN